MPKTKYRRVHGFPKYKVGTDGSLWSRHWGYWRRRATPPMKKKGYCLVTLCDKGRQADALMHRLVLEAFVGPCPPGMECRHRNGVSWDNRLSNLRWGTKRQNECDRVRHGTVLKGERHGRAKLTESEVIQIRKLKGKEQRRTVARRFRVSESTIGFIWDGVTWRHLL